MVTIKSVKALDVEALDYINNRNTNQKRFQRYQNFCILYHISYF